MAERVWLWSTEPNSRLWSKFSKKRKSTWVANPLLWQRYSQRFDVLESKTETMDGRYSKPACFNPSSPKQIFPSRSSFCVNFCVEYLIVRFHLNPYFFQKFVSDFCFLCFISNSMNRWHFLLFVFCKSQSRVAQKLLNLTCVLYSFKRKKNIFETFAQRVAYWDCIIFWAILFVIFGSKLTEKLWNTI